MKTYLLKFLLFCVVAVMARAAVASREADAADPQRKAMLKLVVKIREQLPQGWRVEENRSEGLLRISRDGEVLMRARNIRNMAPGEGQPPRNEKLAFEFRVQPLVTREKYEALVAQNEETDKAIRAVVARLKELNTNFVIDLYFPTTPEQTKAVAVYDAVKRKIVEIPKYHFDGLTLDWADSQQRWGPSEARVMDVKIREECVKVHEAITGLLTRYEPEKKQNTER